MTERSTGGTPGAGADPTDPAAGSDARPLVVCDPDGRPVRVLEENQKGLRKTLEQGHLWALHPGTGRLLPFYEGISATVTARDGWYEAVLAEPPAQSAGGSAVQHQADSGSVVTDASEDAAPAGADDTHADDTGTDNTHAAPRGVPAAGAPEGGVRGVPAGGPELARVLADLADVIASRHRELPEGSYTTHLFTSGAEKIRKKTGEEAVELLLASTRKTMVSESADLIYHLLVLLESEGISLAELAAELERR